MDVIGRGGDEGTGKRGRLVCEVGLEGGREGWVGGWLVGRACFFEVLGGGGEGSQKRETGERERRGGLCQGRLFVLFVPLGMGRALGVGRKGRLGWARRGCCGGERGGVGGVGM